VYAVTTIPHSRSSEVTCSCEGASLSVIC
jgi:hypothetical protein